MAQFSAKKIDTTTINGGQQVVNGSGVTPELFNAPVESALYTEKAIEVLTSNVDVSQANAVGTPTVSFSSKTEGGVEYKYLKFANLKGETGKTGRTGPEGPEGRIGPEGPRGQTGAAAGFGTPTISVETLGEGSDATATVRASGDNTSKVFAFNLGIPKGDTGRGIKTVVSDGNDLIIKYDDKTEERLRGAIQTINALVADSKADFDAALIEENIGKTISYKDNLYLILGRGRTKLVNNGITDYNALYNIPVYIATSEESFNQYLQSYNVDKIISYNGDLYTIVETKNAPIAEDDTIDKLYFNTSLSDAEMLTNLSALTYEDGFAPLVEGNTEGILIALDLNAMGASGYVLVSMQPTWMDVLYASEAMQANPDLEMPSASKGWNNALIIDGAYTVNANAGDVDRIYQQDLWSSYISKEPFGTITEKKVGGVPSGGTAGQVLTKTTDNDYDAEWADVSGGVTDVQVNGTSVVTDGVANILPASKTKSGIITTDAQSIKGQKRFLDNISIGQRSDNTGYSGIYLSGYSETSGEAAKTTLDVTSANVRGAFIRASKNDYSVYRALSFGVRSYDTDLQHKGLFIYEIQDQYIQFYPPLYNGVLVCAPESWSSGTTGSTSLPSAGLYEMKITIDGETLYTTINWDGKSKTLSQPMITLSTDSAGTKYLTTRWFVVEDSGFVWLRMFNVNGSMGMSGFGFLYRKIAIA